MTESKHGQMKTALEEFAKANGWNIHPNSIESPCGTRRLFAYWESAVEVWDVGSETPKFLSIMPLHELYDDERWAELGH